MNFWLTFTVSLFKVYGEDKVIKFNPLSANFTKWSNTLKQFDLKMPTNCLSVFDHFVGLALKWFSSFCQLN